MAQNKYNLTLYMHVMFEADVEELYKRGATILQCRCADDYGKELTVDDPIFVFNHDDDGIYVEYSKLELICEKVKLL